jgi:hypothetical protein
MRQSPFCEVSNRSAGQEIPRPVWYPRVHYRIHKRWFRSWARRIQSHTFLSNLFKIRLRIFLSSARGSPKWWLPFRFLDKYSVCISHPCHACYMFSPSHPRWFNHLNEILWTVGLILWSSMLWNFLNPSVTSSLLGSNILLSTLSFNHLQYAFFP